MQEEEVKWSLTIEAKEISRASELFNHGEYDESRFLQRM